MIQPSVPVIDGLRIRSSGDRLILNLPYDPDDVAWIRSIPGRRWHPDRKCWSIPRTAAAISQLRQLFAPGERAGSPASSAEVSRRQPRRPSAEEERFLAPLRQELRLRGYSRNTDKGYYGHILRFRRHVGHDLRRLGDQDIGSYRDSFRLSWLLRSSAYTSRPPRSWSRTSRRH